jgi:hypothetical protein
MSTQAEIIKWWLGGDRPRSIWVDDEEVLLEGVTDESTEDELVAAVQRALEPGGGG